MSERRPSTASSEKSLYFDAPIMHFFSRGGDKANDRRSTDAPASDDQGPPQLSEVAIPGNPVVNQQPGESGTGNTTGDQEHKQGHRLSRSYATPLSRPSQSTSPPPNRGNKGDLANGDGPGSPKRQNEQNGPTERRSPSLRSLPESTGGRDGPVAAGNNTFGGGSTIGRKGSVRTARSTRTTGTTSGATAAFGNGAALTGPNAEPDVDESVYFRGASAERSLSKKQKDKILKDEQKESKKFSKLLKTESTSEKAALSSALNTLAALQNLHKAAIKREAKAEAAHAKALAAAQKAESRYHEEKAHAAEERARAEARCIEERARWEGKEGEVRAQQERMESEREIVSEMEERIAECAREVERLRIVKGTDEREREAKMIELNGRK
ncbi:hypothetical protein HYDPIDRAFT_174258 [Hydnomerulius pinastri MD-312]|nr:hypothetical protein HYDPIDRAFT_174258 [Hydnomerulius pinastri MD-312]